ncbi:MAG: proline--tRNA ligase [Spirochaetota bacterium]
MRMSRLFSRTLREVPAGAESKGYEYLLRAGYIRQLGTGIFSLLPLGLKTVRNIEAIIREEMEAIGAQEIQMPVVNPAEIWKETGRYFSIDRELSRFKDRVGRDMVLAMTHEEAVTDIARGEIDSHRNLPSLVYQIQTKWRDDPRPRAGLIRVREFTMKDSYSFDKDYEGLKKQYKAHYDAYFRIFGRCALPVIAVGSDSGMMGGKVAHEYMYLSPIGEDTIVRCPACGMTANRQVAQFSKTYVTEEPKPVEEVATPNTRTIEELTSLLDIPATRTAKAVFTIGTYTGEDGTEEEKLIVAVIRGDFDIEEAKLQKATGANRLRPARDEEITAAGMSPGYGSPIGGRAGLIIVDDSAAKSNNLVAGANKNGYHLLHTNYGRDYEGTVADIATATEGAACPECGEPLSVVKGVEVGNIFQLGTRYSETMGCMFQTEDGQRKPVVMGSYGIGVGRLIACIAEEHAGERGMELPITVAPYQVHLVSLAGDKTVPEQMYNDLQSAGIEVLYDDRKGSAGVKFNDADLIGVPIRITIGNKGLKEGIAEVKSSLHDESIKVPFDQAVAKIKEIISSHIQKIHDRMV